MPQLSIDRLDDPRLDPYRQLKGKTQALREGLFITEGPRVTERLLESPYRTHSVLISEKKLRRFGPLVPDDVPMYVLPHALAELLIGFNFHVGVLGCGHRELPTELEDRLHSDDGPRKLLFCDDVTDPDNLGTIIRLASAFGVEAIVLGAKCADHLLRRTIRVSMGYALFRPIVRCDDLASEIVRSRQRLDGPIWGTVLDDSATPLHTISAPDRFGLVLGNEGNGLSDAVRGVCDDLLTIPMAPDVDSLNVSLAAGIFLHHLTFPPIPHREKPS